MLDGLSSISDIIAGRTSSPGPLAWMVTMVDARRWGPLLLGALLLLDDRLLAAQLTQCSSLWKLEATALAVRARSKAPGVYFHSLAVSTFRG